ncbi:MAG: hypothetical protein CENE_02949 [Candidatus Celerinatantimonas neptuna]|nr:MAG: hypothetical protein CENE_02949 [Candidatus Celerinatantimonas neptuna]
MHHTKQTRNPIKNTLLTWLDEARPIQSQSTNDEVIHQLRVCMKRQQAALALHRHDLSVHSQKTKKLQKNCRELANALAQSRDTAVMLALLTQLNQITPSVSFKSLTQHLNPTKSSPCNWEQINKKWNAIKKGIHHLTWPEQTTLENTHQLLRKTYPKLKRQSLKAIESSKPETLHTCRKQIKQWCYQRELIHKQGQKDQQFKQLGHYLGAIHDIDMLRMYFLPQNNIQISDRIWLEQTTQQLRQKYLKQCQSLLQKKQTV